MVDVLTDWFMQMWQGRFVAILAFILVIVVVALLALLILIWWKLPQPARKMFRNNLWGHNPIVFNAYDTRVLKVDTPKFQEAGIGYSKENGWSFVPRLTRDTGEALSSSEQDLITKAFVVEGLHVPAYVGYSGKATIANPELQAFLDNAEVFTKKGNPHNRVLVPRQAFINALQNMKDDMVQIAPMWVTQLVDPRKLKQHLSRSWDKARLFAMEQAVREQLRNELGGTLVKAALVLTIVTLVVGILTLARLYNAI